MTSPAQTSNQAAIALGSNLGDRDENLRAAIALIRTLGEVRAVSSFFDTAPVGLFEQPRFENAALLLETGLAPLALMHALLAIEQAMGRRRDSVPAKGPRVVDLDLLLYRDSAGEDRVCNLPSLMLPHPAMHERLFVLAPLTEIAPRMHHPLLGLTVAELFSRLSTSPLP